MTARVVEFFGLTPLDPQGAANAALGTCPFIPGLCTKLDRGGERLGACTLQQINDADPVICCPNRLYADQFQILLDVATEAFGPDHALINAADLPAAKAAGTLTGKEVAVFGKHWGRELSIPQPRGGEDEGQSFFIDWVLARVDQTGELAEFTAVEVQTIDTTGSYNQAVASFKAGIPYIDSKGRNPGYTTAGFNWANVSKRILPQLIYKGYVLRREAKCTKGLFFICPSAVLRKIKDRLGGKLLDYPIASGTITFRTYDLGPPKPQGHPRGIVFAESFTTTVEQMAYAFVSPTNLPTMGVYEAAIRRALPA
ncbi:MAG: NotI family restriction endonuclease [Caulobacter sp.]|nr:NotI family restriction endonuclease [Caulobacter sp.]